MSPKLRIFLIIASIAAAVYTMRKIRRSQLNIDDSFYWIVLSVLLLGMSIFPNTAKWASDLLGFEAVSNFVFFFMLFMVIVKLFALSVELSVSKHRLNMLIQKTALLNKEESTEDAPTRVPQEAGSSNDG